MGGRLRRSIHRHSKMLLGHLLRKLKLVCVRRYIGHLSLHLEVAGQVLLGLNHAHIDILLVSRSNLLLLLLQNLYLLGDGKLLHCTSSVSKKWNFNAEQLTYSSAVSAPKGCVGGQCAGDGRWG